MFKKVTRFVKSQSDSREELVPVESITDHEHFRLSCLLVDKGKQRTIFHPGPYYQCTRFRLENVLLPGRDGKSTESLLPSEDAPHSSSFTFKKVATKKVDGGLSVTVYPVSSELKGSGSVSQEFSITPQTKEISMESLVAVSQKRKMNMDHPFIRQLQSRKFNLYVVYKSVEASEEAVYTESTTAQGGFLASIYAKFSAKGTTENRQSIVIPKGCTLAFKAIQINIENGKWEPGFFEEFSAGSAHYEDDVKQSVMREVKQHYKIFSKPSDLRVIFLNTIKAVMEDRDLFQELSQKVEGLLEETHGYELKTESPDLKDLLSTLEKSPRSRRLRLAEAIIYTLNALAELLDDQLPLLLASLERNIVAQQLKLVETLVQHKQINQNKPFHVCAELLSFPEDEDLNHQRLTIALVELSRVKLQKNGLAVPMKQPFEVLAALYVVLYILSHLSGSK